MALVRQAQAAVLRDFSPDPICQDPFRIEHLWQTVFRERVVCYPHVGGADTDALIANCRSKVEVGWRFVRWGLSDPAGEEEVFEPHRAVADGIDRVRAVRETFGDDLQICVDVHTRPDPPSAIEFSRGVEPYRPYFIEDPLWSENPQSLRLLRQQSSVPLAEGEQFDSKWAFR